MSSHLFFEKKVAIALILIGVVPAVIILLNLKIQHDQMVVGGQMLGEYSLARLLAGLLSTMTPIYLLSPPALTAGDAPEGERGASFWITSFLIPTCLLAPSFVAGLVVGGRGLGEPLLAFIWLGLISVCLVLWLECLRCLTDFRMAIIIYGAIWAGSGYLGYLSEYIVPYMEISGLQFVSYLSWILPQIQSGPDMVDTALQTGAFEVRLLLPTLVQIPLLFVLLKSIQIRS